MAFGHQSIIVFDWINWQSAYVAGSMVVAVAIWIENIMLKRHDGKLPETPIFYVLSALDSLWVLVSCVAVYFLDFNSIVMSVPVVYILYTVGSWVYVIRTMNEGDMPTSPDDIVFTHGYLSFCQSFALAFFVLCGLVIAFLHGAVSVA